MSRSESETRMRGNYDVTLYYCNDAFPIPLLQYLWRSHSLSSAHLMFVLSSPVLQQRSAGLTGLELLCNEHVVTDQPFIGRGSVQFN